MIVPAWLDYGARMSAGAVVLLLLRMSWPDAPAWVAVVAGVGLGLLVAWSSPQEER